MGALAGGNGRRVENPLFTSVCSYSSVSPAGKGISWPQSRWVISGPRELIASLWVARAVVGWGKGGEDGTSGGWV